MRNIITIAHLEALETQESAEKEVQKTALTVERTKKKLKTVQFPKEAVLATMGSSSGLKIVVIPVFIKKKVTDVEQVTIEPHDAAVTPSNTQFVITKDLIEKWFVKDSEMELLSITVCKNDEPNFPVSIIFKATKGETGGPGALVKLPTPE
jgi:hypothetical protein